MLPNKPTAMFSPSETSRARGSEDPRASKAACFPIPLIPLHPRLCRQPSGNRRLFACVGTGFGRPMDVFSPTPPALRLFSGRLLLSREAGLIPLPPAPFSCSSAAVLCPPGRANTSPCQLLPVERDAVEGTAAESWQSRCCVVGVAVGRGGGAWSQATCPLLPSELEIASLQGPNFTHESVSPPAATFPPSVQRPRPLGSPDGSPASFLSRCLAAPRPVFQALPRWQPSHSRGRCPCSPARRGPPILNSPSGAEPDFLSLPPLPFLLGRSFFQPFCGLGTG